jgi:hypothetical protein
MIYNTRVNIAEDSERFEPKDFDIQVTKGSDFLWKIYVEVPKLGEGWNATDDATGNTARMQWRHKLDSSVTVPSGGLAAYISMDETDPENLIITVDIPASVTKDIAFGTVTLGTSQAGHRTGGEGVYDLEVVLDSGRVFRILEGRVITSDEVTR